MRKCTFALIGSTLLLLSVLFIILCMVIYNAKYMTAQSDVDKEKKKFFSKSIKFEFPDGIVEIPMSTVGSYSAVVTMPGFFESLYDVPTTTINIDWNHEALKKEIAEMYIEGIDARIDYTVESGWTMIEDNFNRDFDIEEVYSEVAIQHPETVTTVDMSGYLRQPTVRTEEVKDEYQLRAKYNDFTLSYEDGTIITRDELFDEISATPWDEESINLDSIKDALSQSYDTTSTILQFTTTEGENISIPYKTYGISVNWEKEKKELIHYITTGESVTNREPKLRGYDNFDNTYIEVDIESQHLWHYVDGELCCETDVVTGTKNRHDTPTGVFYISECIPGKYLTGDTYRTWVNQWMRLTNSGVGLHDAYWRRAFGKDIYVRDGSHGCINMPAAYAKQLFKEVKNGYPVVIH